MPFKLGKSSSRIPIADAGNINSPHVYRDNLEDGVLGEAYDDGSIAISTKVKPGSNKEKEVIAHEKDHAKRINKGDLTYGLNYIKYGSNFYKRKDGQIEYHGQWYPEGHENLPWEALAFKAGNKAKNS